MQVLIGGTRLLFSLPCYGLIGLAALLSLLHLTAVRPKPNLLCLIATMAFMGYVLVRAFTSPVEYLARADIYAVLGGLLIYLIVACALTAARARNWILFGLFLVAIVHILVGVVQFRQGNNFMPIKWLQRFDYGKRASGFYVCPNHLAGLLEVLGMFGLSIACWSRYPVWAKLLVGYAAAACYFGVILTGSRGGYLSTAASIAVFAGLSLWLSRRSSTGLFWRIGLFGAAAATVAAIGVSFFIARSDFLTNRARLIYEPHNMRVELWQAAIQQWNLAPVFGTGSGTYLYYGRQFRSDSMQLDPVRAHNDYLDLLAEYGCAGVAVFLFFIIAHLTAARRNLVQLAPDPVLGWKRPLSNALALQIGAVGSIAAYLVHSIFDFNLHIPANVLLMAFVFAIIANPGRERQGSLARPGAALVGWRLLPAALGIVLIIQAIRLVPPEYLAEQARVALRREHAGTTIRYVERALAADRKNPNLYDYLGRAQVMRAKARTKPEEQAWFYGQALTAFHTGWQLAPRDEDFPLQLAYVYDTLGRFREAEWMYNVALDLDPRSIWAKQFYARHLELWRNGGTPVRTGG
jgi:O-antigen ligase